MSSTTASTLFFFFNDTATTEIYTLSLHDALPICVGVDVLQHERLVNLARLLPVRPREVHATEADRKSTRLNSSHLGISYAVFCLKKKKNNCRRKASDHLHQSACDEVQHVLQLRSS